MAQLRTLVREGVDRPQNDAMPHTIERDGAGSAS